MHFVLQYSSHHGAFSASSASRLQSLHATPQKRPKTTENDAHRYTQWTIVFVCKVRVVINGRVLIVALLLVDSGCWRIRMIQHGDDS